MAKVRNGFVSNSSSSSFIVEFSKDPRDIENLKEMMGDCGTNPYGYAISTKEVIETVHKEIMASGPLEDRFKFDDWELLHDIRNNLSETYPEIWVLDDNDPKLEQLLEMEKDHRRKMYELASGKSCKIEGYVYEFEYSDNDGQFWSAMEHGDIFRNVDHIRESHH